jgi:hypothetical protein
MKAVLALSAQHLLRQSQSSCDSGDSTIDPNLSIQYYYETLHYLQTALQYKTYTLSEEILATAIIISTYEMLDESESDWQRHLKGVFWIQRSQDVNGASGGIRQAVWWAWLRQVRSLLVFNFTYKSCLETIMKLGFRLSKLGSLALLTFQRMCGQPFARRDDALASGNQ